MKSCFCSLILALACCVLRTEGQSLHYATGLGGTNNEHGYSMDNLDDGSVVAAGTFHDMADMDPSIGISQISSNGGRDMYICMLQPDGSLNWAFGLGGTSDDWIRGVKSSGGEVVVTGYFFGTVDFDPSANVFDLTSEGQTDAFIAKYSGAGDFIWAIRIGGTQYDYLTCVTIIGGGYILVSGQFEGIAQFDPSEVAAPLNSGGNLEIVTAKYDANGNYVWAHAVDGDATSTGWGIDSDSQGSTIFVGGFSGTVDMDPGPDSVELSSAGGNDAFVTKWDADGNFLWTRVLSGDGDQVIWGLATWGGTRIALCGEYSETPFLFTPLAEVSFLPASAVDMFAAVLNQDGEYIAHMTAGGAGNEGLFDADFDPEGQIAFSGIFGGAFNVGTLPVSSAGSLDVITLKADPSLTPLWVATAGGTGVDFGLSVKCDGDGNTFASGNFQNVADFNPLMGVTNLSSAAGSDVWVAKYGPCITTTGQVAVDVRVAGVPYEGMTVGLYIAQGPPGSYSGLTAVSDAGGLAYFTSVPEGSFLCRAEPNPALGQTGLMPTYTNETYTWANANIISVGCEAFVADTIDVIELPFGGLWPGAASGAVYYRGFPMEPELETRSFFEGDPIPGIPIILRLDTIPFALNVTDVAGQYAFNNLPEGNYDIVVEIPGLPMAETHEFVVLVPDLAYTDLNFYVDDEDAIYTTDEIGITEISGHSGFSVFPNPAADYVTIHATHKSCGISSLRLDDMMGRVVLRKEGHRVTAVSLDLSAVLPGIYLLTISSDVMSLGTFRLVVR